MKRVLRILSYILGSLFIIITGFLIILWIKSPGITEPIRDANGQVIEGSMARIEKVNLGGLDQYIIIRGVDSTKPVMLFLHGGPGSPELALMNELNPGLEKDFVMVYWEQRGAGKSYSRKIDTSTMNLEQLIQDTRQLSKLLIDNFDRDKLYLMGHSWGSFLGIQTAYRYPELFHAYFGIGQVCHQYRGERVSFDWVRKRAGEENDQRAIRKLSRMSFPDSLANGKEWLDFLKVERDYVGNFGGGITREMKGMGPAVRMVLNAEEYTLGDKLKFGFGSLFSLKNLWDDVMHSNLFIEIDSMQVPVYIFQGRYDYQTPYVVAKEFYDHLNAPHKEFFSFENSAHSPQMEEVDEFNDIVRSIVLKPL